MVAHEVGVDEVYAESAQFVRNVLVTCSHQVTTEVADFAKGAKELCGCETIGLLHALLSGLGREDADEGLEVFS